MSRPASPDASVLFANDDAAPIVTASVEETLALGQDLADALEPGAVLALSGDLGSGKTHLVKGIAAGLGLDPSTVRSPTFTILHVHEGGRRPLYHFDLYRLQSPDELYELGYEAYMYGRGVSVVEWPERAADLLPDETLCLRLEHVSPTERRIAARADKE
jgi:tRNA threonylcarbamoyladenosine biosynthesis protein TsaE